MHPVPSATVRNLTRPVNDSDPGGVSCGVGRKPGRVVHERAETIEWAMRLRTNIAARVEQLPAGLGREQLINEVAAVEASLQSPGVDLDSVRSRLRSVLAITAGLIVADRWQSPEDAVGAMADYDRDRHRLGAAFEAAWLAEMVTPDRRTWRLRALLTSSGMAAVATVLAWLERDSGRGPIVVDRSAYHETRHLLATGVLRTRLRVVDADTMVDTVRALRPAAVVLDAIANRPGTDVADLEGLVAVAPAGCAVVVDASMCSVADPWIERVLTTTPGRVVVIESLTKHGQYGLDRVTAGMIVAGADDADRLDVIREHLGTNIAALVCAAMAPPDRWLARRRLERMARNAALTAARLTDAGVAVAHPSLIDSAEHGRWVRAGRPACPIIGVEVVDPPAAVDAVLRTAARRGVRLGYGVGFGFDHTRIFRTTVSVPEASAFVRVAVGVEAFDEAVAVAEVLATALRRGGGGPGLPQAGPACSPVARWDLVQPAIDSAGSSTGTSVRGRSRKATASAMTSMR